MKKCLFVFCFMVGFYFTSATAMAETVTGFITENYEIMTDEGIFYTIEDNEKGAELMDFIGENVKAFGTIMEHDGTKFINVSDFSLVFEMQETPMEESPETNKDKQNQ